MKTVCIDFDGVIHSYTSPWISANQIPDPPVPGAFAFIEECLDAGFQVCVFSTRNHQPGGMDAMLSWFESNGLTRANHLRFPDKKPMAVLYIDDRAFEFRGVFPRIEWLKQFKPWNK